MLLMFCLAIVCFFIAGVAHLRNPTWNYIGAAIAWGLFFLTAALGWAALKAAV